MSDELSRLQDALRAATPRPDSQARERALAMARENFATAQESADERRPTPIRPGFLAGLATGVRTMFSTLRMHPALGAVSGAAVIGLGLVIILPNSQFSPEMISADLDHPEPASARQRLGEADEAVRAPRPPRLAMEAKNAPAMLSDHDFAAATDILAAPPLDAPNAGIVALVGDQPARLRERNEERFANAPSNRLKITGQEPVSTFSIDVDTSSYSFVRAALMSGNLPPAEAVRVEEMINYFPYGYAAPEAGGAPFSTSVSVFQTPWNAGTELVHIALQGVRPAIEERPPLDLVFLIDTSGSMQAVNKLPLLKQSFRLLLSRLTADDRVAIVTYAGSAGVVLEPTGADKRSQIVAALEQLQAGGSTAGQAGLQQAYALARRMQDLGGQVDGAPKESRVGRVLLATDGDFNVGLSDPEDLKSYIADQRRSGIYLSVMGFGRGNTNDALMQSLAQNGNGTASYIDTLSEAQKVLVDQVSGALFPIANDVKIQVEFNPAMIAEYRLIGYETRLLEREDFNNDKVDAGDIGAGHAVTALYEVTPVGSDAILSDPLRYQSLAPAEGGSQELGFVKLRYKTPGADVSKLLTTAIPAGVKSADEEVRFAAAIAGFGQLLREGRYLTDWTYADAIALANRAKGEDAFGYRAEAVTLMRLAQTLSR